MFEPIHGSAPKHEGKDVANPMAAVLAASMMLEWLGDRRGETSLLEASRTVEAAVEGILQEGKVFPRDLGGKAKGSQVGDALAERVTTLARAGG